MSERTNVPVPGVGTENASAGREILRPGEMFPTSMRTTMAMSIPVFLAAANAFAHGGHVHNIMKIGGWKK